MNLSALRRKMRAIDHVLNECCLVAQRSGITDIGGPDGKIPSARANQAT